MKLRSHRSPPHGNIDPKPIIKTKKSTCSLQRKSVPPKRKAKLMTSVVERDMPNVTPTSKSSRQSITAGWLRAFSKYSPATEATLSPVKCSQANLKSVMTVKTDPYIDICVWVINMSEQFFYDNALLLLNSAKADNGKIKRILRHNFSDAKLAYFQNLVDVTLLGEGTYGSVFSCRDPSTDIVFAVKYISATSREIMKHCEKILDYMSERNSLIRAMNSPFVMKFYYSLQVRSVSGLFLFFEYCIGDLNNYLNAVANANPIEISKRLKSHELNLIENLDKGAQVLDVSLMYIFELFCGLDFLVQSNIVHQDIKPDNLMISNTLHLKIGDFGIVYRTRAIHRETTRLLVVANKIDKTESTNYGIFMEGTPYYQDFELKLMNIEDNNYELYKSIMKNKITFDMPGIDFSEETLAPTFLTDTWAAGIVAICLLFQGFNIYDPKMIHPRILPDVPRSNLSEFVVHLVGRKSVYDTYVYKGLLKAGGKSHLELMKFLASIFLPRKVRTSRYTKEKIMYKYCAKRTIKYVDMAKVEKIGSFKERNFNCNTVFTMEVPPYIRDFYAKHTTPTFPIFPKMLTHLANKSHGKSLINLEPGVTINYFQ